MGGFLFAILAFFLTAGICVFLTIGFVFRKEFTQAWKKYKAKKAKK